MNVETIARGRILVIGAGGLGAPVCVALAAAGVPLAIVDDDRISRSNLQRQLLFRTADVGAAKAEAAARRLRELVPRADVQSLQVRFDASNALALVSEAAAVVDGSDNFATRFLANDACVLAGRPLVHGGVLRFQGQVLEVVPGAGACYRCLFEAPPPEGTVPSCAVAGVLGAACGVVGARMAEAAVRALAGRLRPGSLTTVDVRRARTRTVEVRRDPRCAVCGDRPTIRSLVGVHSLSGVVGSCPSAPEVARR